MRASVPAIVCSALMLFPALACANTGTKPATPSPAATSAASERTPPAGSPSAGAPAGAAATPALALAVQVLLQQSGGGGTGNDCCTVGLQTVSITAPGSWDLSWSYDCSATGRPGNLSIDVFGADGSFVSDPPSLFVIGSGGQGVQNYSRAGTFSLVVNSVCRWNLSVTTSARVTATPVGSNAGPVVTVPAGLAAASGLSAAATVAATVASSSQRGGSALQALQPSIPTPRPVVPAALGAFAGPGVAAARGISSGSSAGGAPGSAAGAASIATATAATAVPSATPPRPATPSH